MSALIDDRDFLSDNLNSLAVVARFAEETAIAMSSSPANCFSPDAWAGFSTVLGLIREGLAELERQNPPA